MIINPSAATDAPVPGRADLPFTPEPPMTYNGPRRARVHAGLPGMCLLSRRPIAPAKAARTATSGARRRRQRRGRLVSLMMSSSRWLADSTRSAVS